MLLALAAVLLLSVWSIWQVPDEDESPTGAQAATQPAAPARPEAGTVLVQDEARASWRGHLRPLAGTPVAGDPFRLESGPAAAEAVLPVPRQGARGNAGGARQARVVEPVPELPFPFAYLGKLERDGMLDVYLDSGGTPMIARPGQDLPGGWRFNGIEAGALAFTHISSNQKKTLSLKVNP
ncbi:MULTISPECIES: hypothetical protein [unclassified Duganella]|uniref:hypothetical protein n=1 Tax=unclassified Duganella TaxID=2636909 RepID=UPI0007002969|nr:MULTISPECIES: hypothetical protein [unclassified Duganella]KQV59724.1 hypothetical protein ASD07_23180 [Duganella sp. Root336D2]KRB87206.1 hypothetical protein ASE26_07380 [Duganella sp. Root198D2]